MQDIRSYVGKIGESYLNNTMQRVYVKEQVIRGRLDYWRHSKLANLRSVAIELDVGRRWEIGRNYRM